MCGPFAVVASHSHEPGKQGANSWLNSLAYNLGRLVTYLVFGLIAGALGMAISFSGEQFGLQQAAIYLAGGSLILFGLIGLLRNMGFRIWQLGVSQKMLRWLQLGIRSSAKRTPLLRAFTIGLLTSLMPCGWLYVFVIAASSTQSLIFAPLIMFAFWVGTVPVLAALGLSSSFLMKKLRSKANWIIPIMMLVIGCYSLTIRSPLEVANLDPNASVESVTQSISEADSSQSACCSDENN